MCTLEMNWNHAIHDDYSMVVAQILRDRSASPLVLAGGRGVAGGGGGSSSAIRISGFFKFIFN
jgi:hypothetical protein